MTPESRKSHHPVQAALDWWQSVRGRWQRLGELESLGKDEIERLANDVGLDSEDLRRVASEPDGIPVLLGRRLIALRLDAGEIRTIAPLLMRDLERTCATCGQKKRCRNDFDGIDDPAGWETYCPNAGALRTLI